VLGARVRDNTADGGGAPLAPLCELCALPPPASRVNERDGKTTTARRRASSTRTTPLPRGARRPVLTTLTYKSKDSVIDAPLLFGTDDTGAVHWMRVEPPPPPARAAPSGSGAVAAAAATAAAAAPRPLRLLPAFLPNADNRAQLAVWPCARSDLVVCGGRDRVVRVFDPHHSGTGGARARARAAAVAAGAGGAAPLLVRQLGGAHAAAVTHVAGSRDERFVVSADINGDVLLWEREWHAAGSGQFCDVRTAEAAAAARGASSFGNSDDDDDDDDDDDEDDDDEDDDEGGDEEGGPTGGFPATHGRLPVGRQVN